MSKRKNTFTRFIEDIVDDTKDLVDDILDRAKDLETDAKDAVKDVVDAEAVPVGRQPSAEESRSTVSTAVRISTVDGSRSSVASRAVRRWSASLRASTSVGRSGLVLLRSMESDIPGPPCPRLSPRL